MAAVAPLEFVANKSIRSLRLEEGSISSVSSASETGRSVQSRRDTEQILDYYQSEDAGRAYVDPKSAYPHKGHTTEPNQDLPSGKLRFMLRPQSAGGDANANVGRVSMESVASSSSGVEVQRRTSQRSARGGDKRRIAIVEMSSEYESQASSLRPQGGHTSESSYLVPSDHGLLARRGVDSSRFGGLALIAPPDTHLSTYTGLSPEPASAPATGVPPIDRPTKANTLSSGHQRSMSDVQSRKKTGISKTSPRDVGIVGTLEMMQAFSPPAVRTASPLADSSEGGRAPTSDYDCGDHGDLRGSLTAPVFQTPKSRSPSPLPSTGEPPSPQTATEGNSLSTTSWTTSSESQSTRDVGQEKDLSRPFGGPVVLDLTVGSPVFRRSPNVVPSGLPVIEPLGTEVHPYGDRDGQRTAGRLPFKQNQTGPTFLHYQPGIHSTAGPLPSPPRHILTHSNTSPPPRPPRLLSPTPAARRNDSGQSTKSHKPPHADGLRSAPITSERSLLPISRGDSDFSIAAVSVSSSGSDDKSPETSPKTPEETQPIRRPSGPRDARQKSPTISSRSGSHVSSRSGSHVREGAFPASSVFLSQPSQSPPLIHSHTLDEILATVETTDKDDSERSTDVLTLAKVEPLQVLKRSRGRPDLKREESWLSASAESGGGLEDASPPSSYSSSREGSTHVSTTNIESDDRQFDRRRASLPAPPPDPQKQLHSLPRTPSLSFAHNKSRTSSPSPLPILPTKPPSSWPEAMNFRHIMIKKSAAERALAYAEKIRELASEETGLRDWLVFSARKERRGTQSATSVAPTSFPRGFVKHPRHVSRGSMASEVTFPIRADSYTATDLSLRPTTDTSSPSSLPSLLPYPSLAHGVGIRSHPTHISMHSDSSSRGMTSATGSSRTLGGAFFASLGRKSSLRKDRTPGPTSSTKLIPSRQVAPIPQPRPVKIAAPPTIPGGPRAPARRANSIIPAPALAENPRPEDQIFSMPTRPPVESTEIFDRQVEKLSDLLPQADKDVLAIYLRRANNQDPMLAIGAYLEDEKQGSLLSE